MRASEEKFRQLAENIHEVFWMMSPTADEILYISPAYEQVWGRTCESLYQNPMSWVEAIHPDDLAQAHAIVREANAGRTRSIRNTAYEHLTGRRNGSATGLFPFAIRLGN